MARGKHFLELVSMYPGVNIEFEVKENDSKERRPFTRNVYSFLRVTYGKSNTYKECHLATSVGVRILATLLVNLV